MNDSIRKFLESMVEDGTSMEDVLNEVASTATEMKAQEDEKSNKEKEINNFLESAANSIIEATKLINPDLVPLVEKCISAEGLKEIIEYMQSVKDFFPSDLLNAFLAADI